MQRRISFGDRQRAIARGVDQQGGEFLTAEPAEQIDAAHAIAGHFGEHLQHAIADGVAEAVVDRFEIVEIEQHHRHRTRIGRLPLELHFAVLQEGAAVGDAGQRIDQRRRLVAIFGALLRHRQQDEGDRDREQQRLEAQHREPHALEHAVCSPATHDSIAPNGVRNR